MKKIKSSLIQKSSRLIVIDKHKKKMIIKFGNKEQIQKLKMRKKKRQKRSKIKNRILTKEIIHSSLNKQSKKQKSIMIILKKLQRKISKQMSK